MTHHSPWSAELRVGRFIAFIERPDGWNSPKPFNLRLGRWFATTPLAAEKQPIGVRPNRLAGRRIGYTLGWGMARYLSVGRYLSGSVEKVNP